MTGVDPSGFQFQLDPTDPVDRDMLTLNAVGVAFQAAGYDLAEERFSVAMAGVALELFGRNRALEVGKRLESLKERKDEYLDGLS